MWHQPELTILENPAGEPWFSQQPEVIGIAITGRCNLRCRHCFNLSGPENHHELPLEIIEKILAEMRTWKVRMLRITGGEPTIHRRFHEILEACARDSLSVAINTNGIYSAQLLSYLRTAPIAVFLVSIDGLERHNDAIRGAGTFAAAMNACCELAAAGQHVMISMHVGRSNRQDVAGLIQLAAESGVDVKISSLRPIGRARDELPGELIRPEEYLDVVRQIVHLRRWFPDTTILTDFDIIAGSPPDDDCRRNPGGASCKAGRTMVNVNYDGRIYPCGFFHTGEGEFSAGNVYDDLIGDVWADSPVFQPFRVHRKSDTCQSCGHYQRECNGGCPAIAHFATGRLDAHDPTCFSGLIQLEGAPS